MADFKGLFQSADWKSEKHDQIAKAEFSAHGASVDGPDPSCVYTPRGSIKL